MFAMKNYGHSICCYITVMRNIRMQFSAVIQLNKYQTLCSKLHIIHSEISRYFSKENAYAVCEVSTDEVAQSLSINDIMLRGD